MPAPDPNSAPPGPAKKRSFELLIIWILAAIIVAVILFLTWPLL